MGAFEYTALDTHGRERKGVLEGDTYRQIRQNLREQGLSPLSVEEVQQREERSRQQNILFRRKISATDLALITRQLATLVRSGFPVEEALRAVAQQTEKAQQKSMLVAVRSKVMEGRSLAVAMGDFPAVFSDLFRSTVEAGEQSGNLNIVLERLADYTEARHHLNSKISQALIYPSVLTIVAIAVIIGLLAYVVPQVTSQFENAGQSLPALTVALIATSDFVQDYGLFILALLVVATVVFNYMLRFEQFRFRFHSGLLKTPLISRLTRGLNTARFARTFSILAASGVPILDGLRIASQVIGNLPMRAAVEQAARKVREGTNLHTALEASGYFPPMTLHLIASGEISGNLEEMLDRAATSQENEMDSLRTKLLSYFEPLIIVVMGGIVLAITIAILLPIFELNQLIK